MIRIAAALALLLGAACAHAERVIIEPHAGLPDAALHAIVESVHGRAERVGGSNLHIVHVASAKAAAALLDHHPGLKFAEADQPASLALVPNDPYLGAEWHLPKIGAPAAWDVSQGAGVTIAIIDTGTDCTHPDLNCVAGWNFYDGNSNAADVWGHGTATAGAAAAIGNNALGMASVAGQARIMPLRVSDTSGVGYWSAIASAVVYAADHGARVANLSWENMMLSSGILSAAQYMKGKGGLVVIAAGNCGCDPAFAPSASVIPVAATDANDALASFSSRGSYVALSAPGVNVWTTNRGGGYGQWLGTSFSSPIVAGTIALMMSANPAMPGLDVERALYASSIDLGAAGRDPYYGYGRVNASAAVAAAVAFVPAVVALPPPPPPPSKPGNGHKGKP